jgi:hypothetical protein
MDTDRADRAACRRAILVATARSWDDKPPTGLVDGVERLVDRVEPLVDGVERLVDGVERLVEGVERLVEGVERLVEGVAEVQAPTSSTDSRMTPSRPPAEHAMRKGSHRCPVLSAPLSQTMRTCRVAALLALLLSGAAADK